MPTSRISVGFVASWWCPRRPPAVSSCRVIRAPAWWRTRWVRACSGPAELLSLLQACRMFRELGFRGKNFLVTFVDLLWTRVEIGEQIVGEHIRGLLQPATRKGDYIYIYMPIIWKLLTRVGGVRQQMNMKVREKTHCAIQNHSKDLLPVNI